MRWRNCAGDDYILYQLYDHRDDPIDIGVMRWRRRREWWVVGPDVLPNDDPAKLDGPYPTKKQAQVAAVMLYPNEVPT